MIVIISPQIVKNMFLHHIFYQTEPLKCGLNNILVKTYYRFLKIHFSKMSFNFGQLDKK